MSAAIDVTDADFETAVLDRSTDVTVVIDLWADWCGPCRTLGPILEKVVGEATGVELVKIDVDTNPRSAATFQVRSIPAVFAIKDRKVVDSFVGALPEPAVREWVARLNPPPTEVEQLISAGDEATLRKAASETRKLITVEDHQQAGGLGEAVASLGLAPRMLCVREVPRSGKPEELVEWAGISASSIVKAVKS